MLQRVFRIASIASRHWLYVGLVSIGFTLVYYVLQLGAMIVKFEQWPNYSKLYDWPGNVIRIIESTPSLKDTLLILSNEWLFEVGYMTHEYGIGLSLWSLFLSPVKVLSIMALGAMLALLTLLFRFRGNVSYQTPCLIAGGLGATAASFSLMSLSWVVCCATPTWVVGLSILGLGASTALWLEPVGFWLNLLGFSVLAAMLWVLAGSPRETEQLV
ncbi:MAG TPA: hypothetical protein VIC26_06400 [Marinagarivorans sp.]